MEIGNEGAGKYTHEVRWKARNAERRTGIPMKRVNGVFEEIISEKNLGLAVDEVNRTHRWRRGHRPNPCTAWVQETREDRIKELREIIAAGFVPREPRKSERYDQNAGKWRTITEPAQWPDQYVHHALIQALQPVMMRGMDPYCCGSIRGRGPQQARKAIAHWMKHDPKGTKYEFCGDIRHFYDSLKPDVVMTRMRQLIKDSRVLDLIWRIIKDGIEIGSYTSQWFANTVLQPLDQAIRQSGLCKHYVRYMDNLTAFGSNFRKIKKLHLLISEWLKKNVLRLKGDWQVFPTVGKEEKRMLEPPRRGFVRAKARLPDAVGYRYGRGYTIPRKHNLLRIKRAIARYLRRKRMNERILPGMASSLISRLGQLKHCNNQNLYRWLFNGRSIVHELKRVIREKQRKEKLTWSMYLEQRAAGRRSGRRDGGTRLFPDGTRSGGSTPTGP